MIPTSYPQVYYVSSYIMPGVIVDNADPLLTNLLQSSWGIDQLMTWGNNLSLPRVFPLPLTPR